MRRFISLILILGTLNIGAQQSKLKTPAGYVQHIIERSIEVPEDTTSVFVFRITKTAGTLLVETMFNSTTNDSVLRKLYTGTLLKQIPDGFKVIAPVHCYRLFANQLHPKQPSKSILDSAASVVARQHRVQSLKTPIVVIAYPPICQKKDVTASIKKTN